MNTCCALKIVTKLSNHCYRLQSIHSKGAETLKPNYTFTTLHRYIARDYVKQFKTYKGIECRKNKVGQELQFLRPFGEIMSIVSNLASALSKGFHHFTPTCRKCPSHYKNVLTIKSLGITVILPSQMSALLNFS